jgi:hypothetical protein
MARARGAPTLLDVPPHVRCAQAMLEMAVEWRMPDVERWAVAWLLAAGGHHLRLRWSSRARDGRFRRESRASGRIQSIAATADRSVVGLVSGAVEGWGAGGEQQQILPPGAFPVWAVAARDHRVVAAGPRNSIATIGWLQAPPRPGRPIHGLKAAAIGPAGEIVLGDEHGRVLMWVPGDEGWATLHSGTTRERVSGNGQEARAVTVADEAARAVRVAWASGEVSECPIGGGPENWRQLHHFGGDVAAAAWNHDGSMLAAATGRELRLVCPNRNGDVVVRSLWVQEDVRTVAWSADGVLASASLDQIYCSTAPVQPDGAGVAYKSITSDGLIDAIALPGHEHVVSVRGDQFVQWELNGAGSDDPTFAAGAPITAVGVRPGERRLTLVGTERGQLQVYGPTGATGDTFQLSDDPHVKQLAWDAHGGQWLVATLDGVYAYSPADEPGNGRERKLAGGLCRRVAAGGHRFAYAIADQVFTSDPLILNLPGVVADVQIDSLQGTLAAIDEDGHVRQHRQGGEVMAGRDEKPWTRLLGIDGGRLLFGDPDGSIRWASRRGDRRYSQLPGGCSDAAPYDPERIIVTYPGQGILLTGTGPGQRSWVDIRVNATAVSTGRIAVATLYHVAGYDVLDDRPAGDGVVDLTACSTSDGLEVRLSGGETLQLRGDALRILSGEQHDGEDPAHRSQRVDDLSEAVYQAGRLGDLLWQAGLDLAIDYARGPDPNRAVRLRWNCPVGDPEADRFPWELLHPTTAPLGWFGEPPITSVRVVSPAWGDKARPEFVISGPSPVMRVVRGTDDELRAVDEAFDRFRRRTRRTDVRLASARPQQVSSLGELAKALAEPADILQLWAHSGDAGVRLSRTGSIIPTAELADQISQSSPRLVVLVGCSSGALGRALVTRGVRAAVAMRVPVHDHTVQSLVEDVTARVLSGAAVDIAFAEALRSYLFTGQPGAAAVPMLYLADDFDGILFPERVNLL